MAKLTKALTEAFTRASKRGGDFGDDHKEQVDALQEIVKDINAAGVFTAEIKPFAQSVPVLEITEKSSGHGQTFFIEFGHAVFSGKKTMKLSVGLARTPIGKNEEGYDLKYTNERDELLKAVGEELARKCNALKTGDAAVKYVQGGKP